MDKIKFPNGILYTGERYGLTFTKGVAEVESDSFIAKHLESKGFELTKEEKKKKGPKKEEIMELLDKAEIPYDPSAKKDELIALLEGSET